MATVTGTVRDVFGFTTPAGPKTTSGSKAVESCIIDVTFAGTYASSDNASIANVHTAIATSRRDGKTVALLSAGFCTMGINNAVGMGAKTVSTSTNSLLCELTAADCTTEWADALLSTTWEEGVKFYCTYTIV